MSRKKRMRMVGVFPGKAFGRPNLAQALPQRIEFGTRRGSRSGVTPQPVAECVVQGQALLGGPASRRTQLSPALDGDPSSRNSQGKTRGW